MLTQGICRYAREAGDRCLAQVTAETREYVAEKLILSDKA